MNYVAFYGFYDTYFYFLYEVPFLTLTWNYNFRRPKLSGGKISFTCVYLEAFENLSYCLGILRSLSKIYDGAFCENVFDF